jgi:hypothetical protein
MERWATSWGALREGFESLPHNGSWASYKWADLCKHVLGYDLEADDIGVGGRGKNAGPIPGMVLLTGKDWRRCSTDVGLQRALLAHSREVGAPFAGLDQLETSLCDFNSLTKGTYYHGHDIDLQQEQLRAVTSPRLWEARRVIPDRFRGELGGWLGVRKVWKPTYKVSGALVNL